MILIMSVIVPYFFTMTLNININVGFKNMTFFFMASKLKMAFKNIQKKKKNDASKKCHYI